jgi:hypothetical protein
MKKYLRFAALAAAITATAALAQNPTSAEVIQYLEQQRILTDYGRAQTGTYSPYTEYYQYRAERQNARQAREAADDAAIMNYFSEQDRRNRESLNALWQAYFNLQRQR